MSKTPHYPAQNATVNEHQGLCGKYSQEELILSLPNVKVDTYE